MTNLVTWAKGLDQNAKRRLGIALVLVALLGGVWFSNISSPEPSVPQASSVSVLAPSKFMVHVAGAVAQPGLYEVESGSRVQDAVMMAGGFSEGALESSVNLARMVSDGEQIVILHESQLNASSSQGFISLNSASASQLEQLPGIGPSTAEKILAHRQKIGSFASIEELTDVPGIGPKLLEKVRDQLTL